MKVLQVLEATLGGTRRYLENVHAALGDGDQNGLVYSLQRADSGFLELLETLRGAGWRLFELDMQRKIALVEDLQLAKRLQRIYLDFKPDVVHAHSSKAGAIARIATVGMKRRPRIVYTPHAIATNLSPVYGFIEKILALRLDILMAVTESERNELGHLRLVPSNRTHVAVPSVSSDYFNVNDREAARKKLNLGNEPTVVAIGRLCTQKDPLAFLDLVERIAKTIPTIRAIWVGDGELRRSLEEAVTMRGLGAKVAIAGWVADVRPYLAACDVFVNTSQYESFGYVTAEALAMARPVVASAIGGTVDVVRNDIAAQLFAKHDIEAAAGLAVKLIQDPINAERIGRRGRESVLETFSTRETRKGLIGAYDAAMSPR